MKKTVGILLVAVLLIMGSVFPAAAEDTAEGENQIFKINISNICTFLWAGEKPEFSAVIDSDKPDKIIVDEKWIGPNELTVSGDNIAIKGGQYRYELKLSAIDGFSFSNDLVLESGKYNLDYSFADKERHTMIVRGDFDNIIATSPLIDRIDIGKLLAIVISGDYSQALDFILDDGVSFSKKASVDEVNSRISHISNDKYSYELILKTNEGFSFNNELQFLYDEDKYGYTINYSYDLSADKHTLKIKGTADKKQTEPEPAAPEPEPAASDLKPGISALAADRIITSMTSDSDPEGTEFSKLRLRSTVQNKSSVKLSWEKLSNAKTYIIYGNICGSGNKPQRIAVSAGNTLLIDSINGSKLKKGTYYKFMIVALDNEANVVSVSKLIRVTNKGSKAGNHKSVAVSKSVISKAKKIRKGKTLKLKARAVAQSKKLKVKKFVGLRYESTNETVATVSSGGKITAKKKGTCYVYAYAQNGAYRKIKVKVK